MEAGTSVGADCGEDVGTPARGADLGAVQRVALLAFLGEPRRRAEVVRHFGWSESLAHARLTRLVEVGFLRRPGRGVYVAAAPRSVPAERRASASHP